MSCLGVFLRSLRNNPGIWKWPDSLPSIYSGVICEKWNEILGMSFPCTGLPYFNYAKVKSDFHSVAPLTHFRENQMHVPLWHLPPPHRRARGAWWFAEHRDCGPGGCPWGITGNWIRHCRYNEERACYEGYFGLTACFSLG